MSSQRNSSFHNRLYSKLNSEQSKKLYPEQQVVNHKRFASLKTNLENLYQRGENEPSSLEIIETGMHDTDKKHIINAFFDTFTFQTDCEVPEFCSTDRPTTFQKGHGVLLLKFEAEITQFPLNISILPQKSVKLFINFSDEPPSDNRHDLRLEGNHFKIQPKFMERLTIENKFEFLLNEVHKKGLNMLNDNNISQKLYNSNLFQTLRDRIPQKSSSTRLIKPERILPLNTTARSHIHIEPRTPNGQGRSYTRTLTRRHMAVDVSGSRLISPIVSTIATPAKHAAIARFVIDKTSVADIGESMLVTIRDKSNIDRMPVSRRYVAPVASRDKRAVMANASSYSGDDNAGYSNMGISLIHDEYKRKYATGKIPIIIRIMFQGSTIVVAPTWSSTFTRSTNKTNQINVDKETYSKYLKE